MIRNHCFLYGILIFIWPFVCISSEHNDYQWSSIIGDRPSTYAFHIFASENRKVTCSMNGELGACITEIVNTTPSNVAQTYDLLKKVGMDKTFDISIGVTDPDDFIQYRYIGNFVTFAYLFHKRDLVRKMIDSREGNKIRINHEIYIEEMGMFIRKGYSKVASLCPEKRTFVNILCEFQEEELLLRLLQRSDVDVHHRDHVVYPGFQEADSIFMAALYKNSQLKALLRYAGVKKETIDVDRGMQDYISDDGYDKKVETHLLGKYKMFENPNIEETRLVTCINHETNNILQACKKNDYSFFNKTLDLDFDDKKSMEAYRLAFYWACKHKNSLIQKQLLEAGVDLDWVKHVDDVYVDLGLYDEYERYQNKGYIKHKDTSLGKKIIDAYRTWCSPDGNKLPFEKMISNPEEILRKLYFELQHVSKRDNASLAWPSENLEVEMHDLSTQLRIVLQEMFKKEFIASIEKTKPSCCSIM